MTGGNGPAPIPAAMETIPIVYQMPSSNII